MKKFIPLMILNIVLFATITVVVGTSQIKKANRMAVKAVSEIVEVVEEPQNSAIEIINSYRQDNNLRPYKYNEDLYQSALESAEMIYTGERSWSHDDWEQIVSRYYENYKFIGENLARQFNNEIDVVEAWQQSKTHNENLLNPKACEYGLANYHDVYVLHIGCRTPKVIKKNTVGGTVTGKASYYSRAGCLGCSSTMTMANGEPLDDSRLTVAYNDAPLNSYVTVKNSKTGQSVVAKVTDTGGFKRHGKIIDLTIATRDAIGCGHVCDVEVNNVK